MTNVHAGDPLPPDLAGALRSMRGRVPSLVDHLLFLRTVGSTNDVALAAAAESGQPTVKGWPSWTVRIQLALQPETM